MNHHKQIETLEIGTLWVDGTTHRKGITGIGMKKTTAVVHKSTTKLAKAIYLMFLVLADKIALPQ